MSVPLKKTTLTEEQIERYSRQILLKEVGTIGTLKLMNSRVAIIGAGGLGCPTTQLLAAAGVGKIRIVDGDIVDLSNLPRQFLHYTKDVGHPKVESIKEKVQALNPNVQVETVNSFVTPQNIANVLKECDYVIEATDNLAIKFLINDACVHFKIPFTIAGAVHFYGQIMSVIPGETTCYRCVFNNPIGNNPTENCSGVGVMGTVPAFAATLQANECLKSLLGMRPKFLNKIFIFDLMECSFESVNIKRNVNCPVCSNIDKPIYLKMNYMPEADACTI